MSAKKSNGQQGRTRNYATVVYPESAVIDWINILESYKVPVFISPLHDKDILPDGDIKKSHYHVIIMFESTKSPEQAQEIFSAINGVGNEKIASLRGYARYLLHMDSPDKYQYELKDIIQLCGADYVNVIGLTTDKYVAISEMIDFCVLHSVRSYADLMIYAKYHKFDWYRVLCDSGTMVIKEFLKSYDWKVRSQQSDVIDYTTGEILDRKLND
jgi:hypothetical protein